jgi:hypothetical protein
MSDARERQYVSSSISSRTRVKQEPVLQLLGCEANSRFWQKEGKGGCPRRDFAALSDGWGAKPYAPAPNPTLEFRAWGPQAWTSGPSAFRYWLVTALAHQ